MPFVEITLSAGRDADRLRDLLRQVHAAVRGALGAPDASIRIILREVPAAHWSSGGLTLDEERRTAPVPSTEGDG